MYIGARPGIAPSIADTLERYTAHRGVHRIPHAPQALADKFSLRFFETSAKNSINVEEAEPQSRIAA